MKRCRVLDHGPRLNEAGGRTVNFNLRLIALHALSCKGVLEILSEHGKAEEKRRKVRRE